jgi:hypothetical protein
MANAQIEAGRRLAELRENISHDFCNIHDEFIQQILPGFHKKIHSRMTNTSQELLEQFNQFNTAKNIIPLEQSLANKQTWEEQQRTLVTRKTQLEEQQRLAQNEIDQIDSDLAPLMLFQSNPALANLCKNDVAILNEFIRCTNKFKVFRDNIENESHIFTNIVSPRAQNIPKQIQEFSALFTMLNTLPPNLPQLANIVLPLNPIRNNNNNNNNNVQQQQQQDQNPDVHAVNFGFGRTLNNVSAQSLQQICALKGYDFQVIWSFLHPRHLPLHIEGPSGFFSIHNRNVVIDDIPKKMAWISFVTPNNENNSCQGLCPLCERTPIHLRNVQTLAIKQPLDSFPVDNSIPCCDVCFAQFPPNTYLDLFQEVAQIYPQNSSFLPRREFWLAQNQCALFFQTFPVQTNLPHNLGNIDGNIHEFQGEQIQITGRRRNREVFEEEQEQQQQQQQQTEQRNPGQNSNNFDPTSVTKLCTTCFPRIPKTLDNFHILKDRQGVCSEDFSARCKECCGASKRTPGYRRGTTDPRRGYIINNFRQSVPGTQRAGRGSFGRGSRGRGN